MFEEKCRFLIRCPRFEDADTRQARRDEKFSAVRDTGNIFLDNCGQLYMSHDNLTVDEEFYLPDLHHQEETDAAVISAHSV